MPDRAAVLAELTQTVLAGRNLLVTGPAGIGKTWLAKAAVANADAAGRPSKAIFGTTSSHDVPLAALSPFLTGTEAPADNGLLLAQAREAIAATLAADGITLLLVDDAELLDGLSGLVLRQLMDFQGLQVILVTRVAADLPPALRNFADGDNMLTIEVSPLDQAGAAALLESVLGRAGFGARRRADAPAQRRQPARASRAHPGRPGQRFVARTPRCLATRRPPAGRRPVG